MQVNHVRLGSSTGQWIEYGQFVVVGSIYWHVMMVYAESLTYTPVGAMRYFG